MTVKTRATYLEVRLVVRGLIAADRDGKTSNGRESGEGESSDGEELEHGDAFGESRCALAQRVTVLGEQVGVRIG